MEDERRTSIVEELRSYNPSLRDRIAWAIAGKAGDWFGADKYAAVPVMGDFAGKGLKKLASRSPNIYNPPMKSPRPFEADYPGGAVADDAGKLQFDIEGRPLSARYVAGRTLVGEGDEAISPAWYDSIAAGSSGASISPASARALGGDAGHLVKTTDRRSGTVEYEIFFDKALPNNKAERVVGHEIGHLIDEVSGQIPVSGLNDELRAVYNDLNNPQSYGKKFGPEQNRYKGDDVQRELMAEAIRAYMVDPNYIKTVAPKTAARIREYVNKNPQLKDIIQFNSLAGVGLAGIAYGGRSASQSQAGEPET